MKLVWLPASDDFTPPDDIRYDIHVSLAPQWDPSPSTRYASVTGETVEDLTGLSAATTYYLLVVAVDTDGHESVERDIRAVTTPEFPIVENAGTVSQVAEDLGLGVPQQVDESSLTFANDAGAVAPMVGGVIVGATAEGGYLRRVEGVSQTSSGIVVETSPVEVAEAVDDMPLVSELTLFDVAQAAQSVSSAHTFAFSGRLQSQRVALASGAGVAEMEWPGRVVTAREIDVSGTENGLTARRAASGRIALSTVSAGGFNASVDIGFEPALITEAKWTLFGGIQSGRVIARGTLSVDANAAYTFGGASSFSAGPIELLRRSYTSVYFIGSWPVYQQVTLSLKAQVSGSATAAITASAHAGASSQVEFGVVYDPSTGTWQPHQSLGFGSSLTAQLQTVGGVQAELRLIPEVKVEFYEAVAGVLSVEPYIGSSITAQGTLVVPCAPLELTSFDFQLGAECFAQVDLSVLNVNYSVLGRTRVCGPYTLPLFDLPATSVAVGGGIPAGEPFDLTATAVDGVHDPFAPSSADWRISPAQAGVLTVDAANRLHATLSCNQAGPVTVTFSGHGVLGELARRCTQVQVQCSVASTRTPTASSTRTRTPTVTPTRTATRTRTATSTGAATSTPTQPPACADDCSPAGSGRCSDATTAQSCGNFDADGCLEWGNSQTCPNGCSNGACACASECSSGQTRCLDGATLQACGNYDGDGCLEWGGNQNCPSGCSGGACSCANDCAAGTTRCTDASTQQTCGNYDADACAEWGGSQNCPCGCSGSGCTAPPPAPAPFAPGNGTTTSDTTPDLAWFFSGSVSSFWIQVDNGAPNFTSPEAEQTTWFSSNYTPTLSPGTYGWRVRSRTPSGCLSDWSPVFFFTIVPSQLIVNGGFESGTSSWVPSGSFRADSNFSFPHSGSGYAYLANADGSGGNNLIGSLYQTVTIPSGAAAPTLRFWYNITSQETGSTPFDVLNVTLQNTSGAPLATVLVVSNLNKGTAGVYVQRTFPLDLSLRGQTIRVHFLGTTDSSLPTTFRVDDVSLTTDG